MKKSLLLLFAFIIVAGCRQVKVTFVVDLGDILREGHFILGSSHDSAHPDVWKVVFPESRAADLRVRFTGKASSDGVPRATIENVELLVDGYNDHLRGSTVIHLTCSYRVAEKLAVISTQGGIDEPIDDLDRAEVKEKIEKEIHHMFEENLRRFASSAKAGP